MTSTPHDALFKAVFSSPKHARRQLRAILPPRLSRRVDWSTLKLVAGSFVDENLRARHSDLLFSVDVDGETVLLHLLFEHQSTVDPLMAFRLLRYMVRIWEHLEAQGTTRLPAIIPIVVSHAPAGWTAALAFEDLIARPADLDEILAFVPRFRYLVDDLATASDDDLRSRLLTALAELSLRLLRDLRRRPPIEVLAAARRLFDEVERSRTPAHLVGAVIHYVLHMADEIDHSRVLPWIAAIGPKTRNQAMRSIAQKLVDEGRVEGRVEGRLEASRGLVLRQLQLKFAALSSRHRAIVDAADHEALDRYAERVLTATSVDEVLSSGGAR